ncbi:EpsG family protein [Planococcus sp. CAU13]|uniref:EpsG family protein n=1 Tax=Planococcus sp. CAU13 TaxID=1541197 RepID=UPI000530057A|nr:EpsG family protein [Planococcus sp. CAU13]
MIVYIAFLSVLFGLLLFELVATWKMPYQGNLQAADSRFAEPAAADGLGEEKLPHASSGKYTVTILLAWTVIFLFSSLRYNVGWDYKAYYATVRYNLVTNIVSNGELATIFLIELARDMDMTNLYFFLNSLITIVLVALTVRRYSKDYWVSIIFFVCFPLFFLNSLSVIRLFTALAITFYAFKFIERGQLLRYVLAVGLAGMFHASAFIAIAFYFIRNVRLDIMKLVIVLVSLPFVSGIINLLVVRYLPKYATYTEATSAQEGTKAVYVLVLIGIVALFLRDRILENDRIANMYFNFYFVGLGIYLMFFTQGTMGHRLSLYGTFFSLLLIPKIMSLFKLDSNRALLKVGFSIFSIVIFLYIVYVGSATYVPYKTIFQIRY